MKIERNIFSLPIYRSSRKDRGYNASELAEGFRAINPDAESQERQSDGEGALPKQSRKQHQEQGSASAADSESSKVNIVV